MKDNIVFCGFMGCGKTTVGRLLAARLHYDFIDMDDAVQEAAGESIHNMLEDGRLTDVRKWELTVSEQLCRKKGAVISTGGGVFTVEANAAALSSTGTVIYLRRDFHQTYPLISNDPIRTIAYHRPYDELKALEESRIPLYEKYADIILFNNGTAEECLNEILRIIQQ